MTFNVQGAIGAKWFFMGGASSLLGLPTTNELMTPDGIGRFNHFQYGSIYWHPSLGAFEIHGAIHQKWASMGWERSVVGYPGTDELGTPDGVGRFNHFQYGSIYWHPTTGPHEVHGAIRQKWASMGWELSVLGYPVSDEMVTHDGAGRCSHFQGGSIFWHPMIGAHEVHGAIRQLWASIGWEQSGLGYPVSDEIVTPNGVGRFNQFQNGRIVWTQATGAVIQ